MSVGDPPVVTSGAAVPRRTAALAGAVDAALVVLFVVMGTRNHHESSGVGNVAAVAAPFLLGLAAGWAATRLWRRPLDVRPAVASWAVTVVVGMVLRRTLFDRGTALTFVILTSLVLAAFLLGWRLVASVRVGRSPRRS